MDRPLVDIRYWIAYECLIHRILDTNPWVIREDESVYPDSELGGIVADESRKLYDGRPATFTRSQMDGRRRSRITDYLGRKKRGE